ncbi:MAG: FtsK/SpoIIIE domain-containing protein [Chloroflexota bacterium]|nr:FtsK/SpoIIIE domain-containing protein [Chloroflexota bacterium]
MPPAPRLTRAPLPPLPDLAVEIPAPPAYPDPPDQSLLLAVLPLAAIGTLALFYTVRAFGGGGGLESALPLIALAGLSVLVAVYASRARRRSYDRRREELRIGYLRGLNYKRARLQAAHDAQRAILQAAFPPASALVDAASDRAGRLVLRRPGDSDFAAFRIGAASLPSPVRISAPDPDRAHPLLTHALALAEQYRMLPNAPAAVRLLDGSAGIVGPREHAMAAMRSAVIQLALLHAPSELRIHVVAPYSAADEWRWIEWLPHVSTTQQGGAADLLAFGPDNAQSLGAVLMQSLNERREAVTRTPHLLLVVDMSDSTRVDALRTILLDGPTLGASALLIAPPGHGLPGDCATQITVTADGRFRAAYLVNGRETSGLVEGISAADAGRAARAMAAVPVNAPDEGRLPRSVSFLELYGVSLPADLQPLIGVRWRAPVRGGTLPRPVRIGREGGTTVIDLDLAEGQHGPHGMIAGTTGSGKSELLQTLICGLVIEHDPRLVTLLLIDFKGGSTFGHFARLPHTVGLVTNLDGAMVERVLEALKAEIVNRQSVMRELGVRDITQYHRTYTTTAAQMSSPSYRMLPHVFVIVDEFAQLAREFPDFLAELVRVAQLGRSLGLHLILGTQSPAEVVTEEMAANLQFRVCFRVQTIEASRAVIRRPDAAYLPADWPGRAYLQVGERGVFRQFQTAFSGADAPVEHAAAEDMTLELITEGGSVIDLLDDTQPMDEPESESFHTVAHGIVETVLDYTQINDVPFMPPLLLPPLGDRIPLRTAYTLSGIPAWNGRTWPDGDLIGAPIGVTDDVTARSQQARIIHPSDRLLVTGASASGKTTTLWTTALSLALSHGPDRLHIYVLSMTGALDVLDALPHVSAVRGDEPERVQRLFRRLHTAMTAPGSGHDHPAILLMIDGFEAFRDRYFDVHFSDLERLLSGGRAAGFGCVMTATSIGALPERLRALFPDRLALRPAHPTDWAQAVGPEAPRISAALPAGRGVISGITPLVIQICLPSEFPVENPASALRETAADMTRAVSALPPGHRGPPPVRTLPVRLPLTLSAPSDRLATPLGAADDDAQSAFVLDWAADGPNFAAAGPGRSGKTNLLLAATLQAASVRPPDALDIVVVDFSGRSLRALSALPHVWYASDPTALEEAVTMLNADTRPAAIVIDDYDLAADVLNSEGGALLRALRDMIRLRKDTYVWAAGYLDRAGDPLIRHLLMRRSGFAFGGREGLAALGARLPSDAGDLTLPGRAVFVQQNRLTVVQIAWVEDADALASQIAARWGAESRRAPSQNGAPTPPTPPAQPLDIDTAGLIDDLLRGASNG